MEKLKIEYIPIEQLKEYKHNAKTHPIEQIKQIENSIKEFNMLDPIAIWKDNTIIEGHGRLFACRNLGYKEVPIIRLDNLTDEQRKAYTLVHNKLTMNSDFDIELLSLELSDIDTIDMSEYGFDLGFDDLDEDEEENPYTTTINIPQYEIKGEEPSIDELIDKDKTKELIKEIENSNVSEEQKDFLIKSAQRHLGFNYSKIAEYYAHQDKEMQELMEKSALVIIDYEDAIKNGYAELIKGIEENSEDE